MSQNPITLLVCALGGEGGGLLTEWLVATARHAGYAAQATSIPGVAQRTGATTYYIEVFPVPIKDLHGKRPVFSLNPVPGALDAIVSSELLETTRQIGNGLCSKERTQVISSSSRTFTTHERMHQGDGRLDSDPLLQVIRAHSASHHVFDMDTVAKHNGTVVSAVMLGAIAGSGMFPFTREQYEAVVKGDAAPVSASAQASLRGFASAIDIVSAPLKQAELVQSFAQNMLLNIEQTKHNSRGDIEKYSNLFPESVQKMFYLGYARTLEYQGADYAALYVSRLEQVLAAEKASTVHSQPSFTITQEMARWLALWMAFDDIVRVADLKSRASRWQRVRTEVKAKEDDLLQVFDHFKPGIPEFAALLPPVLASKLTAWDRKRVMQGKQPWALPLKVGSHSVVGMLSLRFLASLKWLRRRGSRFATEQQMMEQWLQGVVSQTRRHAPLGLEVALCGRLIKGYGSTNERGKDNLLHILQHLAPGADPELATLAVRAAREAALADEAGKALDSVLVNHGAPKRAVKEQPLRFVRKPKPTLNLKS